MSRKPLIALSCGILGAAAVGAGVFLSGHIYLDGAFFEKGASVYDLTDHELTIAQYASIREQLPEDADIRWLVPFQGMRYPRSLDRLEVSTLTVDDVLTLDYFPNLQLVDGTHCADTEALEFLQAHRPDCQVDYYISIGEQRCGSWETSVSLADADAAQLEAALPRLPKLSTLELTGTLPDTQTLTRLMEAFPEISFAYTLQVGEQSVSQDAVFLDLYGTACTAQELTQILPLLPKLETIDLRSTQLTDSELKALAAQFPDTFFLCTLDVAGKPFPTGSTYIDISNQPTTVQEIQSLIPLFPMLKKLDMSGCGIGDEEMDALNRSFPDVKVLWTLQIGLVTLRTDETVFYPAKINENRMPSNEELQKLRYCTEMVAVDLGHTKLTDCSFLERMPHVRFLILADTPLADITPVSNLKELVYLELFRCPITDFSPLLGCTALQDLNIGMIHADPQPLSQMTWLHNLSWNQGADDPATRDAVLQLEEQLPDTNVEIESSKANIRGIWRYLPNYYIFRDYIGGVFLNQAYTYRYWGEDADAILACDKRSSPFAGTVLADIIRTRMENGQPIVGIKNTDSDKAAILYESILALLS